MRRRRPRLASFKLTSVQLHALMSTRFTPLHGRGGIWLAPATGAKFHRQTIKVLARQGLMLMDVRPRRPLRAFLTDDGQRAADTALRLIRSIAMPIGDPNSPPASGAPHNSGEHLPSSDAAEAGGEAIRAVEEA